VQLVGIQIYNLNIARIKNNTKVLVMFIIWPTEYPVRFGEHMEKTCNKSQNKERFTMYKEFATPPPPPNPHSRKITLALQNGMSEFQVHWCLKKSG